MSNQVDITVNRRLRASKADIKKSASLDFPTLQDGAWYRGRITSGVKQTVHKVSGNMRLSYPIEPLDGNTPRKPTVYDGITLPYLTPAETLEAANLPTDLQMTGEKPGAPNTHFLVARFLRATFGSETFPPQPYYDKDEKTWKDAEGNSISKPEAEALSEELADARDAFFSNLLVAPDESYGTEVTIEDEDGNEETVTTGIVGLELWFKVENNESKDGNRIFSNVAEVAEEPPADAVIGEFPS